MSDLKNRKKIKLKIKSKLRLGDEVVVISGKAKGSRGKILAMSLRSGKVIVKGVNVKSKFTRPSQEMPKGGSIQVESPMQLSNIQYWDIKSKKPTRLRYQINQAKQKIRVTVKSGTEII